MKFFLKVLLGLAICGTVFYFSNKKRNSYPDETYKFEVIEKYMTSDEAGRPTFYFHGSEGSIVYDKIVSSETYHKFSKGSQVYFTRKSESFGYKCADTIMILCLIMSVIIVFGAIIIKNS